MYSAGCEIHFCYGHRLLNYQGKCAHLHGHNAKAVIELESGALDRQAMVLDFERIRETVGSWIEKTLDHKLLLQEKDPLVPVLKKAGEVFMVMKENPTAESIARRIFEEARRQKLPGAKVTVWETANSFATYKE